MILFFDFETTGLSPHTCIPLEFACVLVTDSLKTVATRTRIVRFAPEDVDAAEASCSDYVRKMHTDTGLFADLRAGSDISIPLDEIDVDIQAFVAGVEHPEDLQLGGFSVHFDRAWLEVWAPVAVSMLSHRVFNVSTLRKASQDVNPHAAPPKSPGEAEHRALGDCYRSIAYYRWFRETYMGCS